MPQAAARRLGGGACLYLRAVAKGRRTCPTLGIRRLEGNLPKREAPVRLVRDGQPATIRSERLCADRARGEAIPQAPEADMSLHAAMQDACRDVGIQPPRSARPGRWERVPVEGKAPSNRSGAVLIFDDQRGGIAHNWTSGQQVRFTAQGAANMQRDPDAERRRREAAARRERDRAEVAGICQAILDRCTVAHHPYLIAKGLDRKSTRLNSSHVATSYA